MGPRRSSPQPIPRTPTEADGAAGLFGLPLEHLRLVRISYSRLGQGCTTLKKVAEGLQFGYAPLLKIIKNFNRLSVVPLFIVSRGNGGTTPNVGAEAKAYFTRLSKAVDILETLQPTAELRIRIGAGVTACSCFFPHILKEFSERVAARGGGEVSFDLQYGAARDLHRRRDELDIILAETTAGEGKEGELRIPLRLIVHRSHRLARSTGFANMKDVRASLKGERLLILSKERAARPRYPEELVDDGDIRVESLKSYSLLHAMVMAGTAVTLSTPLLLSDEQKRELRVLRLPPSAAELCLSLQCPALEGARTAEEARVVEELGGLIRERLEAYQAEHSEELTCRPTWHVSHRDGEPKWVPGKIWWYSPAPLIYCGWYEIGGEHYHLDGNATRSPSGPSLHLVFKAVQDGNKVEDFVASYVCTQDELEGRTPMAGVWLGRRSSVSDVGGYTPSLGFSVVLEQGNTTTPTKAELDKLLKRIRQGELKQLKLPTHGPSTTG